MANFIIGASGSGKTAYLWELIAKIEKVLPYEMPYGPSDDYVCLSLIDVMLDSMNGWIQYILPFMKESPQLLSLEVSDRLSFFKE